MIEKIMKAVKSSNKKRGRNITIGAVVGMLLSCTALMGADEYLWIKYDGGVIKFSTDNNTPANTENPYGENTWDGADYVNNIALNSTSTDYGLKLEGDLTGVNFINNSLITITGSNGSFGIHNEGTMGDIKNTGSIIVTSTGSGVGYGIYNKGNIGDIINTGLIIATSTRNRKVYGIFNDYNGNKIGDIKNTGLIIGENTGIDNESYGIYNNKTMGNVTNTGLMTGTGTENYAGDGIYNNETMGTVMNTGMITGIGKVNARGIFLQGGTTTTAVCNDGLIIAVGERFVFGIYNNGTLQEDIINNGLILVTINADVLNATGSLSYGIAAFNSGTTKIIKNIGLIIGKSINGENNHGIYNQSRGVRVTNIGSVVNITTGTGNAYGVSNLGSQSSWIVSIVNSGLITGTITGSGNAYGIFNEPYSGSGAEIGTITNTGVVYGKTNAIKNTDNSASGGTAGGTITSLDNYGILVTEGSEVISNDTYAVITNTPNYYGLQIKNGGTSLGDVTTAYSGNTSRDNIIVGNDGTTDLKRNMTIKNNMATDGTGSINGDENDSILNALKNTYEVIGTNDKVAGSIINAYEEAVVFNTADKQLTLSGTIVNGGVKDNTFTIKGSSGTDTLILQAGDITYVGSGSPVSQNTIINGNIDMGNGNNNITLKNGSVVNGKIVTGTGADTIVIENEAVVNGEVTMGSGADNLSLKSGAKVNGNIAMGDDNDTLTIEKGSTVNGTLDGGNGNNDILNFNPDTTRALGNNEINVLHNISNFENMNININVTLFEKTIEDDGTPTDLSITGAENISIGANGVLTLRLDTTRMDNTDGTDKIIGHALYGNDGEITSTGGGKLLLALNGAGNESVVSFGGTNIDESLVTAHETKVKEEINFATTSLLHKVKRIVGTDNEVIITSRADLPTDISYEKLNEIYHSILSVDELGNFNVDDDEKLSTFLSYLNDIYAGNPYSYSSELSRKSAGMFRDIVTENIFKPETNKWMIYGGLTHVDGGTKDTYYGKGYYTYDIGSSDMDADTKITGAYILGEYGVSDTLSSGVVIGGNKLKSDLSNGSKVDGSAMYLGAYAKKYVGNLKVTAGAGFQYGNYDADRIAVNKVASDETKAVMKYSDNYNDMTFI